nr:ribonuclease H-like domain-containing protein [Tanacetum cinerariifolium]
MIDYALWKVIENGATLLKTQVVEGVTTLLPITIIEEKAQRRLEVKARSTIIMGIPNEHQLKFKSIKDAKQLLEAAEKRFGGNAATKKTQRNLSKQQYENFTTLSSEMLDQTFDRLQKLMSQLELLEEKLYKKIQPNSPQHVHEDLEQIHPDDMEEMDLRWQMAMLTMRAKRFLKKTGRKLTINGNETIGFDKSNGSAATATIGDILLGSVELQEIKTTRTRKAQERVSNDSTCSKSCLETVKLLKSQNDQLLNDLKKSELMVLDYKTGEIAIKELRKKLEIAQKEKEGIQLNVDKFEHAFKSLNKLIECQIVDNCKKGLRYESYNVVPPPYSQNFMPPTPDSSFTGLDEFVNKPVVENCKDKSSEKEPKAVRKNDDALTIEEYVSNNEEEDVSQLKIMKKTDMPSIAKIEFVKSKQQEKTVKQETESDEVIKSSVKNLVSIPSEYEVTSDDESECDVPVKDESSQVFTTFSNPIFDDNDDFTSSDDESLSNEDVPMEDFKVYSNSLFDDEEINSNKIDPHYFNVESHLIESFNDTPPILENESSNFDHHDDPSFPHPPPKPPDVEIFFESDSGVLTTNVVKGIFKNDVLMPNIFPTLPTFDLL